MATSTTVNINLERYYCNHCLQYQSLLEEAIETPNTTSSVGLSVKKMFLQSCWHILCLACKTKFNQQCPLCHCNVRMIEINRKMPRHMQFFFDPIERVINHVNSIVNFQASQQRLIIGRYGSGNNMVKGRIEIDKRENALEKSEYELKKKFYAKFRSIASKFKEEKR